MLRFRLALRKRFRVRVKKLCPDGLALRKRFRVRVKKTLNPKPRKFVVGEGFAAS